MPQLKLFTTSDIAKYTNFRTGEIKFGERVQILSSLENCFLELENNSSKYAIIGLPEDIGVRANLGRAGTSTAWDSFLSSFLNVQHNKYCKGYQATIIGSINFDEINEEAKDLDPNIKEHQKILFKLVEKIDKEVSHIISQIVKANKIPIIIGGGHNNAYGNIKGLALAKGKSVNAINFDAHTDLRPLEGRHSGNGFSYAFEEGFLKKYFIFGLHENYTPKSVFDNIKLESELIKYNTYEQISITREKRFETELIIAQNHIENSFYGIEIDLDSIPNTPSSAISPTGFSVEQLRQFIHFFGKSINVGYIHICEAAPDLGHKKNKHLVGKLISYLVTDFIKSNSDIIRTNNY